MNIFSHIKLGFLGILQDNLIFKPNHSKVLPVNKAANYSLRAKDLIITTDDDIKIHTWFREAENNNKSVFIFFHGNTGHFGDVGEPTRGEEYDRQYRINVLKEIEKTGSGYVAVSMRGYGLSDKVKSSEEGFVKDTQAVVSYLLNEIGISSNKIILIGESLGAAIAMIAAEQMTIMGKPPAMVVSVAAFSSMKNKVIELHPDLSPEAVERKLRHRFDSVERLEKLSKETSLYICHPGEDEVTLKDHSIELAEVAKESGFAVTYKELPGAGHVTWNPEEVIQGVLQKYHDLI